MKIVKRKLLIILKFFSNFVSGFFDIAILTSLLGVGAMFMIYAWKYGDTIGKIFDVFVVLNAFIHGLLVSKKASEENE